MSHQACSLDPWGFHSGYEACWGDYKVTYSPPFVGMYTCW